MNDSATEKNTGTRASRRGLQEPGDNDHSLDQPDAGAPSPSTGSALVSMTESNEPSRNPTVNYMMNDIATEKNAGIRASRRGLQEPAWDNDQSLDRQPVWVSSPAGTLAPTLCLTSKKVAAAPKEQSHNTMVNDMVMESAEEKNAGIRATRRGLQELEDSEPSLVALDQPIRVSFVASTSASTQVQGEVVEKDEIEAIQLTGDHLIEDIEWPVEEAIEKPLEVQLCPSTQGDVSDLPERVNPTSSTSVEAIEKAVKVDFPPTQVTSAPQEPGALSDPPECANPTSSTPGVASPGAVAVGGRNSSIGDYTITALVTRASATENQSTSGSTRPVSARLVPDTQEDYELLEEQLRQKEQQLRHQEQQFQRVLEREHVPIAEVIANDEEAQREITATRADERNPSTNKVISLFCGSSWKRISTAIAILVVIGLVVGVVIGLKSPSSNDEACIRDLSKADQDGNGMLNQKEYYYFVNLFTEDAYINLPGFPDLPQPLRRNFFRLRNEETKQLHIGDSKEEVDAEIKDKICKATELTISTLPPPTDSPTQITSETAPPPPPPNNDCENANAVAVDIPSSGSTVHATKSG
jgi:hypothetical protein